MFLLARSCASHGGVVNGSSYQRIANAIFNSSRKPIKESLCKPSTFKIKLNDYRQLSSQPNEEKHLGRKFHSFEHSLDIDSQPRATNDLKRKANSK